ncbi:ATP-binding protein [Paludibacteraceae bacterium OttesenSCG-928-F17]|nr:ATP-binding protein [Paludibacteraceae bacterium OttesenSCG-928-F17]
MEFQIQSTTRTQTKIKMALKGVSSSGKSLGALLIAKGLCHGDLSRVAVIDTENSIEVYSHIGNFNILSLSQPFAPGRYIQAIEACENANMEVIIIDSISHCWHYLLEYHSSLQGNSFTNWNKISPLQNSFVQKILQSKCHIICTMRSKQDYILQTKEGKTVVEKIGLKAIQRNEIEYEFTLVLDIDIKHQAKAIKDRTGLFMDKPHFLISQGTGSKILDWCNNGTKIDDVKKEISESTSIEQLTAIYNLYPSWYHLLADDFQQQKSKLHNENNQQQ